MNLSRSLTLLTAFGLGFKAGHTLSKYAKGLVGSEQLVCHDLEGTDLRVGAGLDGRLLRAQDSVATLERLNVRLGALVQDLHDREECVRELERGRLQRINARLDAEGPFTALAATCADGTDGVERGRERLQGSGDVVEHEVPRSSVDGSPKVGAPGSALGSGAPLGGAR